MIYMYDTTKLLLSLVNPHLPFAFGEHFGRSPFQVCVLEQTTAASPTTSKPCPQNTFTISPGSYQSLIGLSVPFCGASNGEHPKNIKSGIPTLSSDGIIYFFNTDQKILSGLLKGIKGGSFKSNISLTSRDWRMSLPTLGRGGGI